jgi:tetratricopeptide (TPR) repeat protein
MKQLQITKILLSVTLLLNSCTPKTSEEYCKAGQKKIYKPVSYTLLSKAIELDSSNHRAYFLLGDNYRIQWYETKKLEDLKMCRYYYKKAIAIDSLERQYLYFMGETYAKQGIQKISRDSINIDSTKLIEAIEYYNRAIRIDSNYANAFFSRGYCYSYLGDSTAAANDLREYRIRER